MNFQLLSPEITSLQMYTGAGSGPMLAAAASWEGLCSELGSAAVTHPAAVAMQKAASAGDFVAAATYGENAALINPNTGMQVTARTLQLVPGLIGIDLQSPGGAGPIKSTTF